MHDEFWVNPEQPTFVKPFAATLRLHASVPAITFGHLTHTSSARTVWDVRVGRFVYAREDDPSTGSRTTPSHFDRATNVSSGAPQTFGGLTLIRTTAKATLSHYRPSLLGADHQWKIGGQVEEGESYGPSIIPTGVRFVDDNGRPFQAISSDPSMTGGSFITAAAFASDAITVGDRLTVSAGRSVRSQPRHQSGPARRSIRRGTKPVAIISGLGTLYTWNLWSPRLGVTTKLTEDGRTILRGSYGRFSQGVLTGEIQRVPPRGHHRPRRRVRSRDRRLHAHTCRWLIPRRTCFSIADMRAPHTDEYSIGVDREVGRRLALAIAYVRKDGANFIGWTDVGGQYREETRTLPDGRTVPVFVARSTLPTDRAVSADESRRILADVQRPRDGRRKTPLQRLAGVWVVYVLEGRPGFRRPAGRPPRARRPAPWRCRRTRAVRARSQRSHQRVRPAARTIARICSERWAPSTCRAPVSWSPPICSTSAASRGRARRRSCCRRAI